MTHHLDGSSFGDTVTLLSQGLQVNHSLGQNKQHVREGESRGKAQLGTSMGLTLPRWEYLAQVNKKTPSSAPLQTRSRNREVVTREVTIMTTMKQEGQCMFPLLFLFVFLG